MRISILRDDPSYIRDGWKYSIKFNGELQTGCVLADDETGEVWRYRIDFEGNPVMAQYGTELDIEKIIGNVEIIADRHIIKNLEMEPER